MSNIQASSVQDTCNAINAACKAKGGAFATYSCKSVSWDDVQRGTVGGAGLSCWGGNITDTRLWEKSGQLLYTVRSDNWNEKLGKVSADQVAVVVGNHCKGETIDLHAITLADFLKNAGKYTAYAAAETDSTLDDEKLDGEVSIRFQTTFLPVEDSDLSTLEFCTEAYNYNTTSDEDPRNAVLLCTTQGIAFQQDGSGAKKLYHHAIDANGTVHRYWLEAERSKHKVGGAQVETKEQAYQAAARGKATSSVIGIEAMGTRFNVLMTVQIPLEQKPKPAARTNDGWAYGIEGPSVIPGLLGSCGVEEESAWDYGGLDMLSGDCGPRCSYAGLAKRAKKRTKIGKANAARVSRGSEVDTWEGVKNTHPKRDPHQHITVTVVIYNTVAGGVPSADDVEAAVTDMEHLYEACSWRGNLAEKGANFMKKELSATDSISIAKKINEQPYPAPQCGLVQSATVFPRPSP